MKFLKGKKGIVDIIIMLEKNALGIQILTTGIMILLNNTKTRIDFIKNMTMEILKHMKITALITHIIMTLRPKTPPKQREKIITRT